MAESLRVWQRGVLWLARVSGVLPGKPDDGLVQISAGTALDKPWVELSKEFSDAREAWRSNALARRLVSLVSSFVCGDGITVTSDRPRPGPASSPSSGRTSRTGWRCGSTRCARS